MTETDDDFEPLSDGYDYLVDFLDLSFPTERPDREHSYLEVRQSKAATHSRACLTSAIKYQILTYRYTDLNFYSVKMPDISRL